MPSTQPLKLLFDATRLLSRAHFETPTGIDRVDLAYAQALRESKVIDTQFVAFDALGIYRLSDHAAGALLAGTAERWQAATRRRSTAFAAFSEWLDSPAGTLAPRMQSTPALPPSALAAIRQLRFGASRLRRTIDPDAVYLNTSHGRLFKPIVARWMSRRQAGGVFFVHDLIPIEYPQYNRPGEAQRHQERLRLIVRYGRLVIVNSVATKLALMRWCEQQQLRSPAIDVIPLGVTPAFNRQGPRPVPATPYFIVIGTIEPRKNHQMLLRLWQQLAASASSETPRLLVIGRRGWENQATFDLLDQAAALRPLVAEAAGLSDDEIAQLLRGARALLAPSFAEGYGLPVAEALAAGTPVIASDLAAHREIGDGWIESLDPLDEAAWAQAILQRASPFHASRMARRTVSQIYQPPSWDAHVETALGAILACCHQAIIS